MKPRVYIETTVISYAAARPSNDPVLNGHKESTRQWWAHASEPYELFVSQLVLDEIGRGDPDAAKERLQLVDRMPILMVDEESARLAEQLIRVGAVPAAAAPDAIHIAIAAVNGMDYLATWNCKHIANAHLRSRIESCCESEGFACPIICTPEELVPTEGDDDVE